METQNAPKSRFRMLVVADQRLLRRGLLALFRASGRLEAAAEADNCEEAIRSAAAIMPDLVIIDWTLRADAIQMACAIAALCPHSRLIVLDDTLRILNVRTALDLGAMGYWTKRARYADIAAAAEQILAGEPAFCPAARKYLGKG